MTGQDISAEVLQREWVEAVQAANITAADLQRRELEARNARSNHEAAQARADAAEQRYLEARELALPVPNDVRPAQGSKASTPQPVAAKEELPAV